MFSAWLVHLGFEIFSGSPASSPTYSYMGYGLPRKGCSHPISQVGIFLVLFLSCLFPIENEIAYISWVALFWDQAQFTSPVLTTLRPSSTLSTHKSFSNQPFSHFLRHSLKLSDKGSRTLGTPFLLCQLWDPKQPLPIGCSLLPQGHNKGLFREVHNQYPLTRVSFLMF